MEPTITEVIRFACNMHAGHLDKGGEEYILHPLRVMSKQTTRSARIVAVLHDVVEDLGVKFEDLRKLGLNEEEIAAIDAISIRDEETYAEFITRVAANNLAGKIKLDDIDDNSDPKRLALLAVDLRLRLAEKYRHGRELLLQLRPDLQ